MPTVRYTTIDGEINAEKRGGIRKTYVPDPLGSTVALLGSQQQKTDTFGYWPFGETLSAFGGNTIAFRYVGTLGNFSNGSARAYIRARWLGVDVARWITVDPLSLESMDVPRFEYANQNPLLVIDASGLQGILCLGCALSMHDAWQNTDQHWCRHRYTHCLSCCYLPQLLSGSCARMAQSLQIGASNSASGRWPPCNVGIKIGQKPNAVCETACSNAFPNPNPNKSGCNPAKARNSLKPLVIPPGLCDCLGHPPFPYGPGGQGPSTGRPLGIA